MQRWETSARYYCATVYEDLIGDIVMAVAHGGRRNNLGKMFVRPVASVEEGKAALAAIAKRRARRGYQPA
jgi:hypothetical protein